MNQIFIATRIFGLSDGKKIMTFFVLNVLKLDVSQPVSGGHTDTDIHTPDPTYHEPFLQNPAKTRIASCASLVVIRSFACDRAVLIAK